MKRKIVKIYLEKIVVEQNGDLLTEKYKENEKDEDKNNALIATLVYPRSGASTVTSTKYFNLENGITLEFDIEDFWKSGLFKEEVQDETILKITVTDRDKISKFSKFLTKLTQTVIGAGFGAITGGVVNVFLGAVANMALNEYNDSLAIDKDEPIKIIGTAETKLDISEMKKENEINMKLKVPQKIEKSYYKFESPAPGAKVIRETKTILEKDQENGSISLKIVIEDI